MSSLAVLAETAERSAIYSKRAYCFSKTLAWILLNQSDVFQRYMLHATCKSTRYGLVPKARMKLKSCRTYLSTLKHVVCEDSEFAVTVSEILCEMSEEQFIREQHLTFDKVKESRHSGRLNIYQPAFRKLFEWLKHDAALEGCGCDDCLRTCELLLCPEKQAEEQASPCRNCGCGHHYTMLGGCSRSCHSVDPKTGTFMCFGKRQCFQCLRYFANCRFHRMNDALSKRPELREAVLSGRLFLCNFCYANNTILRAWYREIHRPLELGLERLDRGIRKIAAEDISERKLLKQMREETIRTVAVDKEDLLTHRQVAGIMETADDNISKITSLLQEKKIGSARDFLGRLEGVLTTMCLRRPMAREDRDIIVAATRYHVGNDSTMETNDTGEIFVDRKRRRKKTI